ncbi:MAG: hypothetical protein Q9169_006540 [Polycauliona sp. 2 TL-2023]
MMPTDPVKDYASNLDFYDILGVSSNSTQPEIDRAWRKCALKYHPDKVGNDPIAKEKFHGAQLAYTVLSDETAKALYENARNAQLQKKRQRELFDGRRRQMKDDLEAREKGVKRGRDEEDDDLEKFERKFRQLAEDGKRMRMERQDALKKGLEQQEAEGQRDVGSPIANGASLVPELDRTVKIRWPVEGGGDMVKESDITTLFSTFGKVESVTLLGPRAQKKKKQMVAICMVQYASIVGAHSAVKDFPNQKGHEWERFDLVFWAGNKEPDSISEPRFGLDNASYSSASASPSTPARKGQSPAAFLDRSGQPATPTPSGSTPNGHGPRKVPSFSSFSPVAFSTPKGSPLGRGLGVNSPSLEELTMIRLKNAERKRLADEIQREDDAATEVHGPN